MRKSLSLNLLTLILILAVLPAGLGAAPPSSVSIQSGFDCGNVTEIPESECEALVALYNATDGDNWTNNGGWLVTSTPCGWHGVACDAGNVTSLSLRANQLGGAIPPEIGNLTALGSLYLGGNHLSGPIPPEIGNLTALRVLELSSNELSGAIPPEIGNMTVLGYLLVGENRLSSSIPSEVGALTALRLLYLGGNHLSGPIPPEIGNLTALESLWLDRNQLSGPIPPAIGNLTALEWLWLDSNQLSGPIPPEIGNLTALQSLWLHRNQLEGDVPENFINLVNLGDPTEPLPGLLLEYNCLNVPPDYPDANDPLHVFLTGKDPNWHLRQGFQLTIDPDGGELLSMDGKTHLLVPAGALQGDTTFTFHPQAIPSQQHRSLRFAGNSFRLEAEDEFGMPVSSFDEPVVVTITYSDDDIGGVPEDLLGLYLWDETALTWTDGVTTCPDGEYERPLDENTFSVPICHLTEFAVLASYPHQIHLPLVVRGY